MATRQKRQNDNNDLQNTTQKTKAIRIQRKTGMNTGAPEGL
jgi:hypothetical protein